MKAYKETKTAEREFNAIGYAAATFPATSLKGLKFKTRISRANVAL